MHLTSIELVHGHGSSSETGCESLATTESSVSTTDHPTRAKTMGKSMIFGDAWHHLQPQVMDSVPIPTLSLSVIIDYQSLLTIVNHRYRSLWTITMGHYQPLLTTINHHCQPISAMINHHQPQSPHELNRINRSSSINYHQFTLN